MNCQGLPMTQDQELYWISDQLSFVIGRISLVCDNSRIKSDMPASREVLLKAASDIADIEQAIEYVARGVKESS